MTFREQLQSALGAAYAVDRELGGGGMARVWLARDLQLGRPVVVKLLPPEIGGVDADRFRREIQVAAGLVHPHIIPLLSAGDADGILYYTMPYIEGQTLRSRIGQNTPIEHAVRWTHEVADALDYAHRRGVIHRDIKPENILIHDEHALVADFGIARAVTHATDATLTQAGVVLGTPFYMSPEHGLGERELDGRTDVYSLGCVLFELLTGEPPYKGTTAQAIIARHITGAIPSARSIRADVPEHVDEAIALSLAKTVEHRFANAADFGRALSAAHRRPNTGEGDADSIAVLPFANLSTDSETEYFSDGITEEILNALTLIPGMRVVARTSTFALKGAKRDVREIGAMLGVQNVLQGTVRRAGSTLRITTQLVKASSGFQIWAERYDRELTDVFAIQDEIAQAVAGKFAVKDDAPRSPGADGDRRPAAVAAYDAYLRGNYFLHKFEDSWIRRAILEFDEAIRVDPEYALAYAMRAYARTMLCTGVGVEAPSDGMAKASIDIRRAVALDPSLPEAHFALGLHAMYALFDAKAAEFAFSKALALRPNYANARHWRAYSRMWLARDFDGALADFAGALDVDPLFLVVYPQRSFCHHLRRDYAAGLADCDHALAVEPRLSFVQFGRACALLSLDRLDDAIEVFEEAIRLGGRLVNIVGMLAWAYGRRGDLSAARAIVSELKARASEGYVSAYWIALANMFTDRDEVFAWLNRAWDERDPSLVYVRYNEHVLEADPRFAELLHKMGIDD